MSGALPRIKEARLNEGDGEARRKAGLIECSESLLLLLLNRGQGAEQPAGDEGSVEGAAMLEASEPRGVVFGAPGGHMPFKSEEWIILSSTSLVPWVHCVERRNTEVKEVETIGHTSSLC